jgi:hypothetical protein
MSSIKSIKLTKGQIAVVDAEDYERLNQWKWTALVTPYGYYATRSIRTETGKTKSIYMHRAVLNATTSLVDHINGNRLDNRKVNLRLCNHSENNMNMSSHADSTSKYKGVYWVKRDRKWRARIQINKKLKSLGCFDCEIEAALAYNKAAQQLFGEFARLNQITSLVP